ncbi:MAG: extracellular solute-binding protein [Micromonosporaceae bacterium]|nr:extracellular solute-binding protein [Micromonosporaceae bacterium]
MKRRILATAAAALAAMLAAAACGADPTGGDGDGKTAGTIKFIAASYSDNTTQYWEDLVKEFESKNKGVKVELQVMDWDTLLKQVPTLIQTKQYPDILNYNDFSAYAKEGLLHPVKDVMSDDLQGQFASTFTDKAQLDGTQYGVPFIASVRSLAYNKKIFDEIGESEPPKTWDDLKRIAKKAKAKGYVGYGLPLGAEEAQAEFSMWMWNNGGNWKDGDTWAINSDQNVQTLNFLRDLANKDKVTQPNPGKTDRSDGVWKAFSQGKVAMAAIMPHGTFTNKYMADAPFDWAAAPFPTNTGAESVTLGVQDFLMSFKKPGNKEPVSKFLEFFYQQDNYVKFNQSEGFLPVTNSAAEVMKSDPIVAAGIELLPNARFAPVEDAKWTDVAKEARETLGTAMDPKKDPKAVLDRLQKVASG